jgi:glycosyltransferase involved in cell wall biosynthesis
MNSDTFDMAVIIPASNEERYIGACLQSLLRQGIGAGRVQLIVGANGCIDRTEAIVGAMEAAARQRGWALIYQSSPEPGKAAALNRADAIVRAPIRVYLDADVTLCDQHLLEELRAALHRPEPAYATGTLIVAPARSWVTRAYAAFWRRLPFVQNGTVGAGLFAVNAAGRARWDRFPPIISDDTFVRLNFSPEERIEVSARYLWPMVEGLRNLIRVRRRQDSGVEEVYRLYPQLRANEAKARLTLLRLLCLALTAPLGFAVYGLVHVIVGVQPAVTNWSRGR